MMIVKINPTYIGTVWSQLADFILSPFKDGANFEVRKERTLRGILGGWIQCWLVYSEESAHGIVTTSIYVNKYDHSKILDIMSAVSIGGDAPHDVMMSTIDTLKLFAQQNGCVAIEAITNRKGFSKILKDSGVEVSYLLEWRLNG